MNEIKRVLVLILALMVVFGVPGSVLAAEEEVPEPQIHIYSPIAPQSGQKSFSDCTAPGHENDPECGLESRGLKNSGEEVTVTDAQLSDIILTTVERDRILAAEEEEKSKEKSKEKAKDSKKKQKSDLENDALKQYIIKHVKLKLKDHETGTEIKDPDKKIVSVSGMELIRNLNVPSGYVKVVIRLGVDLKGGEEAEAEAEAQIETRVYLVYEEEKKEKKDDDRGGKNRTHKRYRGYNGSPGFSINDFDKDINDDDSAGKKAEQAKKAKEAAEKARMKKLTAQISKKEIAEDTDVALSDEAVINNNNTPDAPGILLLAAAAAAACIFACSIMSDLKILRWYKQKKALHKR